MDSVRVQVKFSEGDFNDALYFTIEEWEALSPEELEGKKQERITKNQEFKNNQPEKTEPTKEELLEEKKGIEDAIESLANRKSELEELTKEG